MSKIRKYILYLIPLIIFYGLGNYALQHFVILPKFSSLELNQAKKDISRVTDAIRREIHHVAQVASDWAQWDDTYHFVQDRNEAYIKSNLEEQGLYESTGINLIYICKLNGEVVWGKIYVPDQGLITLREFPETFLDKNYLKSGKSKNGLEGIVLTSKGPMLIGSRPIVKSSGEGPTNGFLIMGKFLNENLLDSLRKQTSINFSVKDCTKENLSQEEQAILARLAQRNFVSQAQKEDLLLAYGMLPDLRGHPALLIKAELPRDIMAQGRAAARLVSLSVSAAVTLVGSTLFLWFISYMLENRRRTTKIEKLVNKRTADLKNAHALIKKLINSIPDLIFAKSRDLKYVLCNDAFIKFTGCDESKIIGVSDPDLFPNNKKIINLFKEKDQQVLDTGVPVNFEEWLSYPDGRKALFHIIVSPYCDGEGNFLGLIYVARDITEQNKIKEETEKIRRLESLGVLAGGIAHDFNNILTAILGNIGLSRMYISPEHKAYNLLSAAENGCTQARALTQQLLTFSKGGEPIKESASISDLIQDSARFILSGSNVSCRFEIPDNLWPVEVDKSQISQVIQNLVINANHAMPDGGLITIRCENFIKDTKTALPLPEGKYIKIMVKDNGIGISQKYLPRIFDPYFTTKEKGSGLGLAISHSIIQKHGGHIEVESEQGIGTTFTIFLPASDVKLSSQPGVKIRNHSKAKPKVLVMDDEDIIRDVSMEILTYLGYDAVSACDGKQMLELYKAAKHKGRPFDAVIMDLTIPGGMGGKEAVEKLLEFDPEAKAIASSGYANDPVMANFRKYGFKGLLVKPYKLEEISKTLNEVIFSSRKKI
ncbi:response regulator [Desulfohalobiaceae bacterium Ax17]|uniref:CHASE4 domain-containing protein n=1 Tax=Desulfovulcanus ferrireducens TaxID=2831190 RepID=UPI00207BA8C8|nr:CHASE4 domain-containing protein [Desulfovulcanus ferrireducens]MBT8763417.1 response regulator [Desulfovulcanus ferrireducens]